MDMLRVDNVTKRFGDYTAVDGIDFTVKPGEVFGLLGANGAGKTTTMRMVLGLIYPDEGRITWNGKLYSREWQRLTGYLPEERGLYPKLKVSDQLLYLAELRGMPRAEADRRLKGWLEKFEVPEYYDRRVEELSKGNQQKIQFIAAILHDPKLLVLDEAFSGLDPVNADLLKATVREFRERGKTILFSSHRMDHVEELCENICIVRKSRTLLQGSLREIKKRFPRERIVLETAGEVRELEALPGVMRATRTNAGYELVVLDPERNGRTILEAALRQTTVTRFQILEPTLHEIFVKQMEEAAHA